MTLYLYVAHFFVDHYLYDFGGMETPNSDSDGFESFQRHILGLLGLSGDDYARSSNEARSLEDQYRFSSMFSVFEQCIANASNEVRSQSINYVLTCNTRFERKQEKVAEVAPRYGLHPNLPVQTPSLQVVYGPDFITGRSVGLLLPIILVFDYILSDERIIFSDVKYESTVSDDFKTLKREGILIDYDWTNVCDSVLFRDDRRRIREVELEAEKKFLRAASDEDRDYAPLMASHGYATSLKLLGTSLILPGDGAPNAFLTPSTPRSLPHPDVVSNIWIREALTSVLDRFAVSNVPIEEMLEIRHLLRSGDAHSEFRELALLLVARLKDDLRGIGFDELLKEIQFQIQTDFQPTLTRLQREIKELDRKRNRKFLTKIRQEGASLTFNLLGLLLGSDRYKAITDTAKTIIQVRSPV